MSDPAPKHPPPVSPDSDRRSTLLAAARRFCAAFAAGDLAPDQLVAAHFSRRDPSRIRVREHGLARLAPFLGRTFAGADGAARYLALVAEHLEVRGEDLRFTEFLVDADADADADADGGKGRGSKGSKGSQGRVTVRGEGRFTWKSTGQGWDEVFVYVLGFDEEARVETYEIWADSGAAWLASRGEL